LPALCGYVFSGTLADTSLSRWGTGAGLIHWLLLGIGALATLLLTFRLGQIAVKLGLASALAVDDEAVPAGDRNQSDG
jgi:hypothetical protein